MEVKIHLRKMPHNVKIKEGMSILEAGITENISPPYSCMEGHCGACEAKLLRGKVQEFDTEVQAPARVKTCMSKPKSEECELDYDAV